MSSWLTQQVVWDEKALGAFTTAPTAPTPTQSTQASATWIDRPIVWDDSALAAFAPRTPAPTPPTPAPTTQAPTLAPSKTPKPTDEPALVSLFAARSVPSVASLESSMYRGMFLKVYSSPDGGMAGTTSLDTSPQEWHIGRGATMNSLVFRAGSPTGPVLSAGPGTECELPVVWTSPAGVRSQFIVNSTEENPDAYVISTVEQANTGACADGKVRFFTVQANGTLRLARAKPTTATLLSYLWIIKPVNVTNAPTYAPSPTPEPTMAFTPMPTMGAPIPSNINITVRDQPNSMFQYPVAPDLMVGGSIDPLLMSVTTDTPAPTLAATLPAPSATPEPELDFDAVTPPASPQINWTKWIVILCCLTALAVAGYLVYGKTKGKGKSGNAAAGLNNVNNLNDLGDLGNLNLGNNASNNNLGAPPPTTGRK
jgi:hypothetical protein